MQALLLRFRESGEVQPLGADTVTTRVDGRVITATNRNLSEITKDGRFREGLLYRIQVVQIFVPAHRGHPAAGDAFPPTRRSVAASFRRRVVRRASPDGRSTASRASPRRSAGRGDSVIAAVHEPLVTPFACHTRIRARVRMNRRQQIRLRRPHHPDTPFPVAAAVKCHSAAVRRPGKLLGRRIGRDAHH